MKVGIIGLPEDPIEEIVRDSNLIFVEVDTHHPDYTELQEAVAAIAKQCLAQDVHRVVAVTSRCMPGVFEAHIAPVINDHVAYIYNPKVCDDFILVGGRDTDAFDLMVDYHEDDPAPVMKTDITTAEGIRASFSSLTAAMSAVTNAWLELSERLGMNFDAIEHAWVLGADPSDPDAYAPEDEIALSSVAEQLEMGHNVWSDMLHIRHGHYAWIVDTISEAATEREQPIVVLGAGEEIADILLDAGERFLHVEDLDFLPAAIYLIATAHERYAEYEWPEGSMVVDPFGYIPDREGVVVNRLGRQ